MCADIRALCVCVCISRSSRHISLHVRVCVCACLCALAPESQAPLSKEGVWGCEHRAMQAVRAGCHKSLWYPEACETKRDYADLSMIDAMSMMGFVQVYNSESSAVGIVERGDPVPVDVDAALHAV